jgi:hypothetical protein
MGLLTLITSGLPVIHPESHKQGSIPIDAPPSLLTHIDIE